MEQSAMAIWKDQNSVPPVPERVSAAAAAPGEGAAAPTARPRAATAEVRDSMIAPELTIEGKIEGTGNVRIAGRFKGDININGNLNIEPTAHVTGQVQAKAVVVAGELQGNIVAAERVELLESAVVTGDVKAGSLAVAAGSRMRGQVEFGWKDKT
jgi:cytoskeletal protein CcmA (bactofilin family)